MAKKRALKTDLPASPAPGRLAKMPEWEAYFDPRTKKISAVDLQLNLVTAGFDPNMVKAIAITNLIVKEVLKGIKSVKSNKTANASAMLEWRGKLQAAVYDNLENNGDWDAEGANVLKVARDMGVIAGLLSGNKTEAGLNQLKSAFAATKSHTTCSASTSNPASGSIGGGAWCSFGWF